MQPRIAASMTALMVLSAPLLGQTHILTESFAKDSQYHVNCKVELKGTLQVPALDAKGLPTKEAPKALTLTGNSSIVYDERILQVNADRRVERTVRAYRQLEFNRKVGTQDQQSKLRPEVMRLVILRHNQYEVPFCPTKPLLWGEIELVRTDVFVPALVGLLPKEPKAVGAQWKADNVAIQELTDLNKLEKADLECTFAQVTKYNNRDCAVITFKGTVEGIGEDGNSRHELKGFCYVDLAARFTTFLQVNATHEMLDNQKKAIGKIEGTLQIWRGGVQTKDVGTEALKGLALEPNPSNTLLLFEHPQIGARFLYPRNWRINIRNEKQIEIDEVRGSGLLITLWPAASAPKGVKFHEDTKNWLAKQKDAKKLSDEKPRIFKGDHGDIEAFSFDTELGKERLLLQYYAVRQNDQGATVAGRITQPDQPMIRGEVERMIKSLQLRGK